MRLWVAELKRADVAQSLILGEEVDFVILGLGVKVSQYPKFAR